MQKRDNICEISLLGLLRTSKLEQKEQNLSSEPFISLEEIFQSVAKNYDYLIYTYVLERSIDNITNRVISEIEYYHNEKFKSKPIKINSEIFYKNVKYMTKLDEYLIASEHYIKYISNAIITSDIGNVNIVELSRTDRNIEDILKSLGYRIKQIKAKKGFFYKYRSYPIIAFIGEIIVDNKEKINNCIEIIGYYEEKDKEKYNKIIKEIISQLSSLYIFD